MDLTIPLEKVTLNIRVAALVKGARGYILEKNKAGYYFPVGGRIKAGETSEEALKREVQEELGVTVETPVLRAVIESFFVGKGDCHIHEICFAYVVEDVGDLTLGDGFEEFTHAEMQTIDFRPQVLKEAINSDDASILHLVSR